MRFSALAVAALASAPAAARDIDQIEHIVIFMQENRAFSHYFDMLDGVRGFNDRTATVLPSGLPVFMQPASTSGSDYIMPFPMNTLSTSSICCDAPTMEYYTDIAMWNGGRIDAWNTAREPGMGMAYMTRADMPFYYTLHDSWVTADQYHQSTFTCTNPNRMHLFTGSNGLSAGFDPVIDNTEPSAGYTWKTMGEVLEEAGVSWKVYQQEDNFDDNANAWFAPFINSKPGDPLYDKGMARVDDLIEAFDADMANGTLPQVSWIVGPANVSEHATWWPSAGEDFTARILKRVAAHPEVYARMAFILNYDEGGQFFDHSFVPVPPLNSSVGVSTTTVAGEVSSEGLPMGLGFRVPAMVISPWTRGKAVVSQIMDHTSVVKLIEERFNVTCPNISPWRRAVTGDLLAFFNWTAPDYSWPELPDTSGYVQKADEECHKLPPPEIPATQTFPQQEPGTRIARALPYAFLVSDSVSSSALTLRIANAGASGAPFMAYDVLNMAAVTPHQYAVEAGKAVADPLQLQAASGSSYWFALHGPNGFLVSFAGDVAAAGGASLGLSANLTYSVAAPGSGKPSFVVVTVANANSADANFSIVDNVYGIGGPWSVVVPGGASASKQFDMSSVGHWYDFTVAVQDAQAAPSSSAAGARAASMPLFERRFMGHMETGVDTISDPAMAAGKPGFPAQVAARMGSLQRYLDAAPAHVAAQAAAEGFSTDVLRQLVHPPVPEPQRRWQRKAGTHKDARWDWDPAREHEDL